MNMLPKLNIFKAILTITLISNTIPTNTMKRAYKDTQDNHSLLPLPSELLQKILGCVPNKYSFMQVCKQWKKLLEFKTNWLPFVASNDIARTLHLTHDVQLRIYRLLLASTKKDDLTVLNAMLAHDPDRSIRLKELSIITHTPLLHLMSGTVRSSEIIKNYPDDFLAESAPASNSSLALPHEGTSGSNEHTQRIATLCDILLQDNQEKLDHFLADPTLSTLFDENKAMEYRRDPDADIDDLDSDNENKYLIYNVDFLIDNDLITRFCSINTVEKLIPLLQQIFISLGEDEEIRLADYLLYQALFGTVQRLDIAEKLLRDEANWKFRHPEKSDFCITSQVVEKQDSKALELLLKYGVTLGDLPRYGLTIEDGIYHPSQLWYSVYKQKSTTFVQKLIDIGLNPFESYCDLERSGDILDAAKRLGNDEIVKALENARLSQQGPYTTIIAKHLGLQDITQLLEIITTYEKAWEHFTFANLTRNRRYYTLTSDFVYMRAGNEEVTEMARSIFGLSDVCGIPSAESINCRRECLIAQYAHLAHGDPLLYKSICAILKTVYNIIIQHIDGLVASYGEDLM